MRTTARVGAVAMVLAACGGSEQAAPQCLEGKCDAAGDVREQLEGLDDPIAIWLLNSDMTDEGVIDTDYLEVVEQVAAVMQCPMDTMRTFVLSDDLVAGEPFPRLISTVCSNDETRAADFFVAASFQDPADPDDVDARNLEMFAWDKGRAEYVFYATLPIEGQPGKVQVEVSPRRCEACHLNSTSLDDDGMPMLPIMNELTSPWPHWSAEPDFPSHTFELPDATSTAPNFSELTSGGRLGAAPLFEQLVRAGVANRVIGTRLKLRREPAEIGQAMSLLRPLFCDEQINYATEDHGAGVLGASAVVTGGTRDMFLAVSASNWPWQWLNNNTMRFTSASPRPLAMVPVRGNADVEYEKRLVGVNGLTAEQVLQVRALDWSAPVFSDLRCGLWTDARARFRTDPPTIPPGAKNADLLPILLAEILELDGRPIAAPAGQLVALRSAADKDALVAALAGGGAGTDCAAGFCATDLLGFGALLDAEVKRNEADRALLEVARTGRLCRVTADFPNRPAFEVAGCRNGPAQGLAPEGGQFGLQNEEGEPFFAVGEDREIHLIPDGGQHGVEGTIAVAGAGQLPVDFVTVRVAIAHGWRGDLEISLTAPGGHREVVATFAPDDSGDDVDGLFVVPVPELIAGEGVWTLTVLDRAAGEQGLLEGWSLGVNAEAPSLELPGARLPPG